MSQDAWTLIGLAIAVSMMFLVGHIAQSKGLRRPNWMLGAAMFWPLALPWVLLKTNRKTTRQCADCHARVPFNAPVCRHCGRDERVRT